MERQRQRESSILVYMVAYHIKHHMQHTAVCVPLSSPPPPVLSHLVTIEVTVKDVQRAVVALVVHVRREVLQLDADLITVVVLAALELSVANREIEIGIWASTVSDACENGSIWSTTRRNPNLPRSSVTNPFT